MPGGPLAKRISVTTTITKFVDSDRRDRTLIIAAFTGSDPRIAFNNSGDESYIPFQPGMSIPLSAGTELWLRDAGASCTADIIVS